MYAWEECIFSDCWVQGSTYLLEQIYFLKAFISLFTFFCFTYNSNWKKYVKKKKKQPPAMITDLSISAIILSTFTLPVLMVF